VELAINGAHTLAKEGIFDRYATRSQHFSARPLLVGGWVKRLVEFPLERGGSVLVEVDDTPAGPAMRGLGRDRLTVAERADKTFEDATETVVPAVGSLIARLQAAPDAPDEIGIEFGVQLSAQTGAFIASAAVAANFRVFITWRRKEARS
jgi:hypothetical protein